MSNGSGHHKGPSSQTLLIILLASLLIKAGLALVVDGVRPVNDEYDYLSLASGLATEGSFNTLFRPPFYPGFISAIFMLGGTTLWVRLSQAVLSTIVAWLVFDIANRTLGRKVGLVAGAIVAFDPLLIFYSLMIWSETIYLVPLLAATRWIVMGDDTGAQPRSHFFAAGLCFGIAALTRPQILTFMPIVALWLAYRFLRRAALPIVLLTLGCCAVVLPWTVRNAIKTQSFILIDTNGAYNFLVSTEPEAAFVDKDDYWSRRWARFDGTHYAEAADREPGRVQSAATEEAFRRVAENPLRFASKSLWEAGHLWTLDSFLLRHLRNDWFGKRVPDWLLPVSVLVTSLFTASLVFLGIMGIATTRSTSVRSFTILALIHATALFGLTYSLSRYGVPLRPFLAIFAAAMLVPLGQLESRLRAPWTFDRKGLLLLIVVAGLASVWVRDMPLLWDNLQNGGHNYLFERAR